MKLLLPAGRLSALLVSLWVTAAPLAVADSIEERIVADEGLSEVEAAELANLLKTAKDEGITFVARAAKGRGSGAFGAPLEVVNNSDTLALSALTLTIRNEIQRITIKQGVEGLTQEQIERIKALQDLEANLQAIQRKRSQTQKDVEEAMRKNSGAAEEPADDEESPAPEEPEPESFLREGETKADADARLNCEDLKQPWDFEKKQLANARLSAKESQKKFNELEKKWQEEAQKSNDLAADLNTREKLSKQIAKEISASTGKERDRLVKVYAEITTPYAALKINYEKTRAEFARIEATLALAKKDLEESNSSLAFREKEEAEARQRYEGCIKASVAEGVADGREYKALKEYMPLPPVIDDLVGLWKLDNFGDIKVDTWAPHSGMVIRLAYENERLNAYIVTSNANSREAGFKNEDQFMRDGVLNESWPSSWSASATAELIGSAKSKSEPGEWSKSGLAMILHKESGMLTFSGYMHGYRFVRK